MGNFMNSSSQISVSEPTARHVKKTKAQKKARSRRGNGKSSSSAKRGTDPATTMAAAGTLTRTKALLLAALRVWELKHRMHDRR